jgi:hypothetical protein
MREIKYKWCEFQLNEIETQVQNYVADNVPQTLIQRIPPPHVTLLYGCSADPACIGKYFTKPITIEFGEVNEGSVSPVLLARIISQDLHELFYKMYEDPVINHDKSHTLIDGKYDPHLTLAWLTSKDAFKFEKRFISSGKYIFDKIYLQIVYKNKDKETFEISCDGTWKKQ